MDKKVSIITPCYNGEEYVSRYLDSLLIQTYTNIELIFVNDGSTDNTEEIVKSYIPKFEQNQMTIKYIYQANAGQARAINKGLEIFTGDYLTWPDSDDMLTFDSIEKKVRYLEKFKEYAIVRSDAFIVNEKNLSIVKGYFAKYNNNKYKEDLFLDYVIENKVWFAPGCFMVRSASFLEVNRHKKIYPGNGGQNWQMLLPLMYKFKCGYIDEALYTYVVRDKSHSHKALDLQENLNRCYEHEDILMNTIKSINMPDSERQIFIKLIQEKYIKKRFSLAINYNERELAKVEYLKLRSDFLVTKKETISYFIVENRLLSSLNIIVIKLIKKTKAVIKSLLKL